MQQSRYSKSEAQNVADKANIFLGKIGIKTQVRLFACDPASFLTNADNFNSTDAVVVLGLREDVIEYTRTTLKGVADAGSLSDWTGDSNFPETSETNNSIDDPDRHNNVVFISSEAAIRYLGVAGEGKVTNAAFILVHGVAHNTGEGHYIDDGISKGFGMDGDRLQRVLYKGLNAKAVYFPGGGSITQNDLSMIPSGTTKISHFFTRDQWKNSLKFYKSKFESRFGKNEPVQNQ